jgi:hypothetical protein
MGILIKNNIVNQKGNPAWYEDTLDNRPTANLQGRMFVDTNNPSTGIYRDTGSSWVAVADPGAGTTGTLQQVTTNGSSTNVGISVSANGIGIGTTIPGVNRLDIHTGSGINATFNGTGTTNAALQLQSAGVAKWGLINNYNAGANDFQIFDNLNSISRINISNAGVINFTGSGAFSAGITATTGGFSSANIAAANGVSLDVSNNAATFTTLQIKNAGAGNLATFYNTSNTGVTIGNTGNISTIGNFNGVNSISSGYAQIGSTHTVKLDITQTLSYDGIRIISNNATTQNTLAVYHNATTGCVETTYLGAGSYTPLALNQQGGNVLIGTGTNGNSKLRIVGLPTSSAGLASGDVYSNLGILTIVP